MTHHDDYARLLQQVQANVNAAGDHLFLVSPSMDLFEAWVRATGVCALPPRWGGVENRRFPEGAIIVIEGAVDEEGNLGLFPELLRSGLHPARRAIEAYSSANKLEGRDEASACGLLIAQAAGGYPIDLRARDEIGVATYKIDRWD